MDFSSTRLSTVLVCFLALPDLPPDRLEELGLGQGTANGIVTRAAEGISSVVARLPLSMSPLNETGIECVGETSPLFSEPQESMNFDSL